MLFSAALYYTVLPKYTQVESSSFENKTTLQEPKLKIGLWTTRYNILCHKTLF